MINLVKGQNAQLNMDVFHVGLGWDVNEGVSQFDFDLDVSAFMIDKNKKLLNDNYLVFYNSEEPYRVHPNALNKPEPFSEAKYPSYVETGETVSSYEHWRRKTRPVSPEYSVIGSIDDMDGETSLNGDDETMDINLSKVNADVQEIIITVSIYDYQNRRQNFGQVDRAYVRLYKPGQESDGEGEFLYDLTEDFSACAAVEFCRLYRHNGLWKVQALGIGHKGGLEELVQKYV